ncbi:MAG: sigma-70 family RNA polymerase sigma factor [Chloroherpetonaceae bacterium]|nr:sigma-70 family RNA polymerase sigma factor [Chloroherpetonaceae bacterium]
MMVPLTNPHFNEEMHHKTDGELLQIVAERSPRSEHAFAAFYNRYIEYVFFICKRKYGTQLCEDEICDLVQETFVRVFERADTFCEEAKLAEDERRRRTQGWLQRIMANIFIDRKRRNQSIVTQPLPEGAENLFIAAEDSGEETQLSKKMQLVQQAIASLPERDQDIVRTIYQWYEPSKKLPSTVIAELVERYQTTPENIRKILS